MSETTCRRGDFFHSLTHTVGLINLFVNAPALRINLELRCMAAAVARWVGIS